MNAPAKPSGWLLMALGWALGIFSVTLLFHTVLEERRNPNRVSVLSAHDGVLTLEPNIDDQYLVEGYINDEKVLFLLDTGATHVAVSSELAQQLGLPRLAARPIQTAAGPTVGHKTRLPSLKIGHFVFTDLSALIIDDIIDGGGDNIVLLGMNALRELDIRQQGGKIMLSVPRAPA